MSKLGQLRKKWNYDKNAPRCEICVHYKKPGYYLKNSLPRDVPPACKLGGFQVTPLSLCDKWEDQNGDNIEYYE